MNSLKQNQKNKGFSLLELLLALAIFSLGSYAIGVLLFDSIMTTRVATDRSEALLYAQEGITTATQVRDTEGWANLIDGNHGVSASTTGYWYLTSNPSDLINNKYTRVVNVTASTSAWEKIITSSVSWSLTSGRPMSISLKTYLTNWK